MKLKLLQADRESQKYPQVVTFTEGDPLDEEVREYIPRPPLPEVNRIRGRLGLEYNSIQDRGSGMDTSQLGFVLRADMTRLGGSYWNLSGYYRGRLTTRRTVASQLTLSDLINRTYHLSLTYNNPGSRWVAGFGRLYLPWAASLSIIDGGYVGSRIGKGTTVGVFGGSAPDPTSWSYDPNRQMVGGFVNFEGGHFESIRYATTAGMMYGITFGRIWRTGIRADARYSKFDSSFGSGTYHSLLLSREIGESLRIELQAGEQNLVSPLTRDNFAWWVTTNFDWFLGLHYFLGGGYTVYRGEIQSYDQWFLNLGYRF